MTSKKELKRDVKIAEGKIAELERELEKWQAELEANRFALDLIETSEFLADNDAPDLFPGTKLALCESFFKLMENRHYNRESVAGWYGGTIKIDYVNTEDEVFGIVNCDQDGQRHSMIGGIPLDVIIDMYHAQLKLAA